MYKIKLFAIGIIAAIVLKGCAIANNKYELSQRALSVGEKPSALVLPSQTPLKDYGLDENGVVVSYLPDGEPAYNVFEVSMQAMQGRVAFEAYPNASFPKAGLLPRLAETLPLNDPYQLKALDWLMQNATELKNGGLIWEYRFDNAYNDVKIKAPWGSAFGQAHVIQAFHHAFNETGEKRFLELLKKAYIPYKTKIEDGGFLSVFSDGSYFFEEVPSPHAAHILNGHMISTHTLLDVGKDLDLDAMQQLGEKGLDTIERHIEKYDTGYWSKYDLNPKKGELIFRLNITSDSLVAPIKIDSVSIQNAKNKEGYRLDVGGDDDAIGAWRISGLEWEQIETIDNKTVRGFTDGPAKHCKPVKGGSIQNSYFVLELPYLNISNLTKPPKLEIEIEYLDVAEGEVKLELQDISHGNYMVFRPLPDSTIRAVGGDAWKKVSIPLPFESLGWYVGIDYQKYHVKLLNELFDLTAEEFLNDYAQRWQGYIDDHSETNAEYGMTTKTNCNE